MKKRVILAVMMASGAFGCASTNMDARPVERGWSGAWNGDSPMHVGDARVMDTHVNPLAPVRLASHGEAVALSYGRSGRARAVAHVDAESLLPIPQPEGVTSPQPDDASGAPTAANGRAARVVLDGGRFVLVWKRGDVEWGYRALAQEFGADGRAVGAPVLISPPDVDVVGSPQAVTTDGRHLVATFTVASENAFELMAVPINADPAAGSASIARK